jgi:TonB-linked SusC/RagA family outer membrane protein
MKLSKNKPLAGKIWLAVVMFITSGIVMSAQTHSVSGRVSDEKGELLAGVAVYEKGTTNGTLTDENGQYTISLAGSNPILVFSSLGFEEQEIVVNNRSLVDVALVTVINELDEIVVVGYGTQRKISVVGSQASIKTEQIKMPSASLSSVVAGRLAGVVSVQRTGEPGHDETDIWIRGISTFANQHSRPLVLVDGVERSFNNIDPEDIESFTVLKDASATAVYGVRGANGVIIIKTKPGKVGKPKFAFDYYESITRLTKIPKLADAYTYMDAANEAYMNSRGAILYTPQYIEATKKADGLIPNDDPIMFNSYLYPNVNWINELFKPLGHNRRAQMSVRGGVPNATYYVSLTYYNESGLTRNAKMENYNADMRFDRYNYTANLNLRPTETTTLDLGFSGYLSEGNYPQQSTAELFDSAFKINPVYLPVMMPDGSVPGLSAVGDLRNPLADLTRRGYKKELRNQLNSNIRLTQDLGFFEWSKGLSARALLAFDVNNSRTNKYDKQEDTFAFSGSKNTETGLWNSDVYDAQGNWNIVRTHTGHRELVYSRDQAMDRNVYFEAAIDYNREFGKHAVSGLLLYNQNVYAPGSPDSLVESLDYKQQGIAARATYSYDDRYFGELNAGYNGSENFDPNNRFGFFPAAGIGWAVSNESFWKPIKDVWSFFKIRYTIGLVGSDSATGRRFMYQDEMGSADGAYFGTANSHKEGWAYKKYGSNVGWSTSLKQNLGFDLKFFKDELSIGLEFFKEHRTGIFLQRATIPDYCGFIEMPYANLGVVDNKGIDFNMEYNKQLGSKTYLTLRGNLTWNEDRIVEDDQPAPAYPWLETRGTNVLARWGWIAEGLFTSEDEILDHARQFGEEYPGQITGLGDIKYKDLNGDNVIDDYDKCVIGQGDVPKLYYGFGADLQVGHFSIGVLFSGNAFADRLVQGNGIHAFSDQAAISNLLANITDRWSAEDPTNTNVFYPKLHFGKTDNLNNTKESTWWQKDVSFLRLKQMTISYNLPSKWLDKTFIDEANVYLTGTNLLTFSNFKLWDPELNTDNGSAYPNAMTISLGLNVKF